MCFGQKSRNLKGDLPNRIPPVDNNQTSGSRDDNIEAKNNRTPKEHQGESLSLDLFAQRQKRLKEAYPGGNVPKEMQRFHESGMAQGNLGGSVGGGAGMAMTGGF